MGDMTGIFNDLQKNRRERELATHTWGVFKIGSKGKLNKMPCNTHRTQEAAEKQARFMCEYNPGKTFVAKEL